MLKVMILSLIFLGLAGIRGMVSLKKFNDRDDKEIRNIARQSLKENFM